MTLLDVGVRVLSSDGKQVGHLRHVVLDRTSFKATHIVVDIGLLRAGRAVLERGLLGEYDRTIAFEQVRSVADDGVTLALTEDEVMRAPEYTAEHFEEPYDLQPEQVDLGDALRGAQTSVTFFPGVDPAIWIVPSFNKGRNVRDIRQDTPVWRQEPHEKIGEVDQLILDDRDRVTAFVIRRGMMHTHDVVLPTRFVSELLDDIIRVEITDAELEALAPHEG